MSNKNKIPLNLFSFIHCKKTIPENMQNNWNNIVNLNPEFNCKLFDINDAHNFIEKNFDKDILYSFEKLKPYSYKSDLFRFCYLYINGGIYVDIKYTPVNSFKFIELINNEYLVKEPLGVQTCLIVLKHRSKLMLECISDIVSFTKINFYSHTPLFTGPYLLSELYKKHYELNKIDNDLIWEMNNHLQTIHNKDKLILIQYDEYRNDLQKMNNPQPHYNTLFWNKDIYNL
jgi:mannosyltransferase OCH1-like enzyme